MNTNSKINFRFPLLVVLFISIITTRAGCKIISDDRGTGPAVANIETTQRLNTYQTADRSFSNLRAEAAQEARKKALTYADVLDVNWVM